MAAIANANATHIRIVDDKRSRGFTLENENLVAYLACYIGMHFLRRPVLINNQEKQMISRFLGEDTETRIFEWIQAVPLPDPEPDVIPLSNTPVAWVNHFDKTWKGYRVTWEKCSSLGRFILEHPCIWPSGDNEVMVRPYSINIESKECSMLSDEKIIAIQMRSIGAKCKVLLVSNYALSTLKRITQKYDPTTVSYTIVSNEYARLNSEGRASQGCPCVMM